MEGRPRIKRLAILFLLLFFDCSSKDRIDQSKFEKLYRAGKALSTADPLNLSRIECSQMLRQLEMEISIAKDFSKTNDEMKIIQLYEHAAALFSLGLSSDSLAKTYQNAGRLNEAKNEFKKTMTHFESGKNQLQLAETYYKNGKIYK